MTQEEFIPMLFESFPFVPTEGQKKLALQLSDFLTDTDPRAVFILKGYAGTGKTSLMSALVRVLPRIGKKSVLLAPTGRAAKVFSGYSGQPASTIHKRIYFQRMGRDGNIYLALQNNLFKNAVFLVDEASMIAGNYQEGDSAFGERNLLDDLIQYVSEGENCKLMLIGDTAQLPPVGMEISPALDLKFLRTRYDLKIYDLELTEVMRQAEESGILLNATSLRNQLARKEGGLKLVLSENRDVMRITGTELEDHLNSGFSSGDQGETIVVCRSNKRANMFNQEIRRRILFQENDLSTGDYLMVVRNNYFWLDPEASPGFIANGDIIEVLRLLKTEEMYGFRFADATIRMTDYPDHPTMDVKLLLDTLKIEGPALRQEDNKNLFNAVMEDYHDIPQRGRRLEKVRTNPFFNALQVKFAYAMTCHKTQGGQWKNVFIDQGYLPDEQVDREYFRWLYTALTRATEKVYLINFKESFFT